METADFNVAPWLTCKSLKEAGTKLEAFSYPLVLKAIVPEVQHKSDSGAVVLNIKNKQELLANADALSNKLDVDSFLVQEQISDGIELFIGGIRDPQYGPIISFGLGGVFVEALKDISYCLAPFGKEQALAMIKNIKANKIFNGYRGFAKIDLNSLAELLAKTSEWYATSVWMKEFDMNPVIAKEHDFVIVDIRIHT